ncbi:MAG: SUMF1/EgtB/PvdO family nonheme iron enzyme [Polyangiaceae bacterium]
MDSSASAGSVGSEEAGSAGRNQSGVSGSGANSNGGAWTSASSDTESGQGGTTSSNRGSGGSFERGGTSGTESSSGGITGGLSTLTGGSKTANFGGSAGLGGEVGLGGMGGGQSATGLGGQTAPSGGTANAGTGMGTGTGGTVGTVPQSFGGATAPSGGTGGVVNGTGTGLGTGGVSSGVGGSGGTSTESTSGGTTGGGGTSSGVGSSGSGGLATGGVAAGGNAQGGNTQSAGTAGTVQCANPYEERRGSLCVSKMLLVATSSQSYRIDLTEVTHAQYEAWLAQTSGPTSTAAGVCSANLSYVPTCPSGQNVYAGVGAERHPIVCVDWCDARAYCEAIGKHLCGKRAVGGGANSFSAYADATQSEWYNACVSGTSGATINYYPYGRSFDDTRCNGAREGIPSTTAEVGAFMGCQSAIRDYSGVFDLSGNVAEWEDSCEIVGSDTRCRLRGGTFEAKQPGLRCDTDAANAWSLANIRIGFRCCADP